MARTRRSQPTTKLARQERLERDWERQVSKQVIKVTPDELEDELYEQPNHYYDTYSPREIDAIRKEAEIKVNARAANGELTIDKQANTRPFSVQAPATDDPTRGGGGELLWWIGGSLDDYIPVSEYGNPKRIIDLRAFALVAPMVLAGESILTKKAASLQWVVEGGRNQAKKWQERLNQLENGDGWDIFVSRWVRAYCESDKGGYAELIRAAPTWAVDKDGQITARGEGTIRAGRDASWEIIDARVMDPAQCFPTTSKEFPLIYRNRHTGYIHQLRQYQYMHLIDMPGVDDRLPNHGVCCVSRAVWDAQEDRMITRYAMEALSENPGAGMMVGNVSPTQLETALSRAEGERDARGVVYYKGIIFLPVLDPTGRISLEFISFSHTPENFSRTEYYNIIKEKVATAFGLDVLEFGSIPGRLGTALQAKVAAEKARGKSIGAIMQGVERNFRYKMLPEGVTFSIKKQDIKEEFDRAEVDKTYFDNAETLFGITMNPMLSMQYLAHKGAVPDEEPFISTDLTPRQTVVDVQPTETEDGGIKPEATEAESLEGPEGSQTNQVAQNIEKRWARYGPRIRMNRDGKVLWVEPFYRAKMKAIENALLGLPADVTKSVTIPDNGSALEAFKQGLQYQFNNQQPPVIHVHEQKQGLIDKLTQRPANVTVNVPDQPPPVVNVMMKADDSNRPINVTVEPQDVYIHAELEAPDEVIETETMIDRNAFGQIGKTTKTSRRRGK